MAGADALFVALTMLETPRSVKLAQSSRLPPGVTFLLEIAAGEAQAVSQASKMTGRSQGALRTAASFFIEQVLLQPGGDSYRVLGCNNGAPIGELRRNMALIMRWLHPDVTAHGSADGHMDRSIFANRITQAWGSIKTEERRASYDLALAAKERDNARKTVSNAAFGAGPRRIFEGSKNRRGKRLIVQRVETGSFWSRLRQLLGGRR
jgi:hypothetical protein